MSVSKNKFTKSIVKEI